MWMEAPTKEQALHSLSPSSVTVSPVPLVYRASSSVLQLAGAFL